MMEIENANTNSGVNWRGFNSAPYDIEAVRADNAAWALEHRPRLMRRDEEQRIAREEARRLEAEKNAALAWCRENGNPHSPTSRI